MTLIEDLLDLQIPQDVKISRDGNRVVYSTKLPLGHKIGEHFCSTLWLADTGVAQSSRKLTSGDFDDRDPQWNLDGRAVAFISDREVRGQSSAIYTVSVDTEAEPCPVTPPKNRQPIEAYAFRPCGDMIAYVSADERLPQQAAREEAKDDPYIWGKDWPYGRLRLVEVATKEVTTFLSGDAHVTSSFVWSGDGKSIAFTQTRTPDIESADQYGTEISIIDIATKVITAVCTFPKALRSLVMTPCKIYFIAGANTELLATGEVTWCIDLKRPTEPAWQTYLKHIQGQSEHCVICIKATNNAIFASYQSGMYDMIRCGGTTTFLERNHHIATWDAVIPKNMGIVTVFSAERTASPPEIVTFVHRGYGRNTEPIQLSNHGSGFQGRDALGKSTVLRCRSADDEIELEALLVAPTGKIDMPLPTIVYLHGGPYGRITDQFNPTEMMWSNLLLASGYAVLFPNYRGSSGRGHDFAESIHGAAGTKDYDDVITLTQYAIEQGHIDRDRLVAAGWSQGGFLAYLCTVRNGLHGHGWKFKATIAGAGISDGDTRAFTSDIGGYQDDMCRYPPWKCDKQDITNRQGSAIWEFKAATDKGDVIPPILILHGENDERVSLYQAIGFRRALMAYELPFEMVVYPREPHMFVERRHLVDMAERVLAFVNKYIGPG